MGKDRDTEKSEVPGSQEMAPDFAEEGGKENTADKPEGTDPKNPAAENETVPDGEIPGQGEGGPHPIAQAVLQVLLRRVVGPLRRLVFRQGGAEGADLSGQTGVVEEQRLDV